MHSKLPTKCGIILVRMRSRQAIHAGSVQAGVTFIFGKQGTGVSLAVRHSRPLYSVYLLFVVLPYGTSPSRVSLWRTSPAPRARPPLHQRPPPGRHRWPCQRQQCAASSARRWQRRSRPPFGHQPPVPYRRQVSRMPSLLHLCLWHLSGRGREAPSEPGHERAGWVHCNGRLSPGAGL